MARPWTTRTSRAGLPRSAEPRRFVRPAESRARSTWWPRSRTKSTARLPIEHLDSLPGGGGRRSLACSEVDDRAALADAGGAALVSPLAIWSTACQPLDLARASCTVRLHGPGQPLRLWTTRTPVPSPGSSVSIAGRDIGARLAAIQGHLAPRAPDHAVFRGCM